VPKRSSITLIYYGRDADDNRLDLYDASVSYTGLARTLSVIGHFYVTGEIIAQAPRSSMPLYISPPEEGSLKQQIIAGIVGGIVTAPFSVFATRIIDSWVPAPNPQLERIAELLEEQNELKRAELGLPRKTATAKEQQQSKEISACLLERGKEIQTIRSITSNSFKAIYRPIGRSADQVGIIGGQPGRPRAIVDETTLGLIEADEVDQDDAVFLCIVNSFSRSSKTGIVFSRDFEMGFRIEYTKKGRLPREDDFSWSQYRGMPIRVYGRFVRYFDGNIKKFLVFSVERVTDPDEVKDYQSNQREVHSP
jgi:hypothetical protein